MQDPVSEVASVVKGLVSARNASEQKQCVQTYFAPDASFDHPFCAVASGPNSRDNGLLPIYQWLRCMFTPDIETHHIGFDEKANKLFLDVSQRLTPSIPLLYKLWAPVVRLVVVLHLQRGADGKFYIKRQEDFYEPQVILGIVPFVGPLTQGVKVVAGWNCAILAGLTQVTLGYWRPGRDPLGSKRK